MTLEQRKLAAIMVADTVGYSRMMATDERGTLIKLAALKSKIIDPIVAKQSGRIFKSVGDGFLVEFASAVHAVTAAQAIQQENSGGALQLRIGIHLGDVILQGDDLMGDGVNIAARIESVAEAGGIAISRAVHEQVRDKLDLEFIDRGEIELKNIARPMQVYAIAGQQAATLASATPVLALPDKPSIAVLPFQNMSGDPEQEYFADGMVEDIISALSRFKSLFVIARNSSFAYKGKSPDIRQVGRELGVRYVLEGSVRRAGNRIRIAAQLVEAVSGTHLWADRFDGELDDVFDLQDRVAGSIVGTIAPRVEQTEIAHAKHRPAENIDAYDYLLRAMAKLYELTGPATDDTLSMIDAALERDPKSPMAHALKAACYSWRYFNGWMRDIEQECAHSERHALRALELAGDDAAVLAYCGYTLAAVNGQLTVGLELVERALELNPNLALGWALKAWIQVFRGEPESALKHAEQAIRLSPIDMNIQSIRNCVGQAHFFADRFAEAASWARLALQAKPGFATSLRLAAASEALLGNLDASQKYRKQLQDVLPGANLQSLGKIYASYRSEHVAKLREGLEKAGLPE